MSSELVLFKAVIDAWEIGAKREKEAANFPGSDSTNAGLYAHWDAQQTAFKRVQELFDKMGVK